MDRRKAMKIAAGAIVAGGAGMVTLATAFKPKYQPLEESRKLEYKNTPTSWMYHALDPALTAELAYKYYDSGSCMYATCRSIISQLADQYGEPYSSFPYHMMKYGHGGIGGYGTTCGALNAAGAILGLFVSEKAMLDTMITGLFRWYEETSLPEFKPQTAIFAFNTPSTISGSTLCHASNTNWVNETGYKVNSDERKERCRRLTSDVVLQLTRVLNEYFGNTYVTAGHANEDTRTCMTCHGDSGKLGNTSSKMGCTSCHTESTAHKVFADIHYKLMKAKI
jgi:hypothetical protein